jgi:hypothetical protein
MIILFNFIDYNKRRTYKPFIQWPFVLAFLLAFYYFEFHYSKEHPNILSFDISYIYLVLAILTFLRDLIIVLKGRIYYITKIELKDVNNLHITAYKYNNLFIDRNFTTEELEIISKWLRPVRYKLIFKDKKTKKIIFEQYMTGEWAENNNLMKFYENLKKTGPKFC